MIQDVLRMVPGTLPADACRVVYNLIEQDLPRDGVILDLNCGQGRSTVLAARALQMTDKEEAMILSVDSHVINPLADRPHETGSLLPFLTHLRLFKVISRVMPLVYGVSAVTKLLNKKSANLVLIQLPMFHGDANAALREAIDAAQFSIRTGGKIVVFGEQSGIESPMFSGFKLTTDLPYLRAYTAPNGKEKEDKK
jgi:hypothetical protein